MSRRTRVSPLTIVLPQPPLPRRRSSLLSVGSASSTPRTPRSSCAPAACASWVLNPSNRKSTDSWNSSNYDFGDEGGSVEWKTDHILLLQRTLDALPSHLVTPFHGPTPPSNLLDKIARGIAKAKGSEDWPFSLRATRLKLAELARARAKDDPRDENTDSSRMSEPKRRSMYRQSSMDFMHGSIAEEDVESINRTSSRLQRNADCIPTAMYHPHTRSRTLGQRRSSSPPRPGQLSPSTPSSSTLTSMTSILSSRRRSGATVSSMTSNESLGGFGMADAKIPYQLLPSSMPCPDPRVQRVRRSESFCAPISSREPPPSLPTITPAPTRQAVKRAPSYGAIAQEIKTIAKDANDGIFPQESVVYPSSDEEEKLRSKQAKKARTRSGSVASCISSAPSPPVTPEIKARVKKCKERTRSPTQSPPAAPLGLGKPSANRPRMNPQRNPSMFGEELHTNPHPIPEVIATYEPPSSPSSASQRKTPTLRRVKRIGLAPSRRISFGSVPAENPMSIDAANDADVEDDDGDRGLASAFQLR